MKWIAEFVLALAMVGVGAYEIANGVIKMRSVATDVAATDHDHERK